MKTRARVTGSALVAVVWTTAALAAPFALDVEEKAPPERVSEEIRGVLDSKAIVLSDENEPVWQFWFRKEVALPYAPEDGQTALDVVKRTTLLGVLQLHRDQRDYKNDLIEKGLYTLRFAQMPQDGNHMGTAPYPHFVVLLPASFDQKVDLAMDHDDMVDESIASAVAQHPMNLSLQPLREPAAEYPSLADGVEKTKVLEIEIATQEAEAPLRLGLVYEGVGKIQ
jgi:hypothetical protein